MATVGFVENPAQYLTEVDKFGLFIEFVLVKIAKVKRVETFLDD